MGIVMKFDIILESMVEQDILRKIVSRCLFHVFDDIKELGDTKKVKHVGPIKYLVSRRELGHLTDLGEVIDNDVKREIILYGMKCFNLIDIFVGSNEGTIPYENKLFRKIYSKIYSKILKYVEHTIDDVNTIKQKEFNKIV